MKLVREGWWESFTLGSQISPEQTETITELAEKHGFRIDGLRSFERPVTAETVAKIRVRAGEQR